MRDAITPREFNLAMESRSHWYAWYQSRFPSSLPQSFMLSEWGSPFARYMTMFQFHSHTNVWANLKPIYFISSAPSKAFHLGPAGPFPVHDFLFHRCWSCDLTQVLRLIDGRADVRLTSTVSLSWERFAINSYTVPRLKYRRREDNTEKQRRNKYRLFYWNNTWLWYCIWEAWCS